MINETIGFKFVKIHLILKNENKKKPHLFGTVFFKLENIILSSVLLQFSCYSHLLYQLQH